MPEHDLICIMAAIMFANIEDASIAQSIEWAYLIASNVATEDEESQCLG